jgi:hypothetical protein
MNDPRRLEQTGRQGAEPTMRFHQPYPGYADPPSDPVDAEPSSAAHGQSTAPNPIEQRPRYHPQEQATRDRPRQLPPDRAKTPRWLWVTAAAAVALVIVMVIALVMSNGSAKDQAVVPPLPAMPSSKTPVSTSAAPSPPASSTPGSTATTAALDPVVYSVTGEGRAISITYRDSGDVIATEFNVALPWSKEVSLSKSGNNANVTIVNIGHDVTCTLTVAGTQVRQRTGVGLTICDAPA